MTATCPACGAQQIDGLLCDGVYIDGRDVSCTHHLRRDLLAAADLLTELDVSISRQAKIGGGKAGKGGAHELWVLNPGAVEAADRLRAVLTTWARDIAPGTVGHPADVLLDRIPDIRRHPSAADIQLRIADAVKRARWAIDRPAERQYLGTCLFEEAGATCHAELWARLDVTEVTCTQCETTHPVAERRAWLLQRAANMIVTVADASSYVGEVGHIVVTQSRIRGYIHRKRLVYRPGTTMIRLGDLLEILIDDSGRQTA